MIYIEDLVLLLNNVSGLNQWDNNIINSFAVQIFSNNGFTEKQAGLAVKILKKHSSKIYTLINQDVTALIDNPVFRLPYRVIDNKNKISIVNDDEWGKLIKFEFIYNEDIISKIKQERKNLNYVHWNNDEKAWFFSLDEPSIGFIGRIIDKKIFTVDENFTKYAQEINNIVEHMEQYVPMVILENNIPKYINKPEQIPDLTTTDITEAVFEARRYGITTWDDSISKLVASPPVLSKFVNHLSTEPIHINSIDYSLDSLKLVIKNLLPIMFIIPVGSELKNLTMLYNFLIKEGYTEDEMAVMFRLSNEQDKEFNEFVRNHRLNLPISDKTKFVFVSTKIPKTVFKSKIQFNCLFNLGYVDTHYTMREYMKNCQTVVYYTNKKPSKDRTLVYM